MSPNEYFLFLKIIFGKGEEGRSEASEEKVKIFSCAFRGLMPVLCRHCFFVFAIPALFRCSFTFGKLELSVMTI